MGIGIGIGIGLWDGIMVNRVSQAHIDHNQLAGSNNNNNQGGEIHERLFPTFPDFAITNQFSFRVVLLRVFCCVFRAFPNGHGRRQATPHF